MMEPGAIIDGRYEVETVLGEGGLAVVYRVRHLELGSLHALKLLRPHYRALADRLLLEGRIQAQLRHPNVVAVTDVVRHGGQLGLLMEYVDHFSLEELLEERGALPLDLALELFAPILAGVNAAHRVGVLHRDLKPANVLLARTPRGLVPKVSDFGIAKVVADGLDGDTRDNVAMGTPGYMAPEQVIDAKTVDARTDVFALGAILYELLTGRRAFVDDTGETSIRATLRDTQAPVRDLVPEVPSAISEAIDRALSKAREDRHEDVASLARALLAHRPSLLALFEDDAQEGGVPLDLDPGLAARAASATPAPGRPRPTLLPPSETAIEVPVEPAPGARRRSPAPFWTGLGLAIALVLVASGLGLLVAGPALGLVLVPTPGLVGVPGGEEPRVEAPPGERALAPEPEPPGARTDGGDEGDGAPAVADVPASTVGAAAPVAAGGAGDAAEGATASPGGASTTAVARLTSGAQSAVVAAANDLDAAVEPLESGPEAVDRAAPAPEPAVTAPAPGTADPEPAPAAAVAPAARAPAWLGGSTWEGRLFRQPFTLRIVREQDGEVVAEGRVVQGASQRLVALSGTFDAASGRLRLREVNGDLLLDGTVSASGIRGTYQRRGDPDPLDLARR
jgi:eukaryotic-like serine/threonine-protein kinase